MNRAVSASSGRSPRSQALWSISVSSNAAGSGWSSIREDMPELWSADDPDAEWRVTEEDTIESVTAAYAEEVALSDAIIERQDDLGREVEARGRVFAVRWILMHLIEEIARHAGHADIIREIIDGETGYVR